MLSNPRRVRLAALCAGAGAGAVVDAGAQLPGETAPPDKMPDKVSDVVRNPVGPPAPVLAPAPAGPPGPTMLPAPYLKPSVGTRLLYDAFANVIVRTDSWRVDFRDDRGEMGARVGGFIPDNPKIPLALDAGLFAKLWPLRIGNAVDIEAQRYPLIWRWHIAVIGTAHVVTQADPFDCFIVEAVETPVVSTSNRPYTDVMRYWYAPSIGQLVRVDAPGRADGAAPPARSGGR